MFNGFLSVDANDAGLLMGIFTFMLGARVLIQSIRLASKGYVLSVGWTRNFTSALCCGFAGAMFLPRPSLPLPWWILDVLWVVSLTFLSGGVLLLIDRFSLYVDVLIVGIDCTVAERLIAVSESNVSSAQSVRWQLKPHIVPRVSGVPSCALRAKKDVAVAEAVASLRELIMRQGVECERHSDPLGALLGLLACICGLSLTTSAFL